MKESEVSELILKKIENSEKENNIKEFLIEILNWEMDHDHEERPRFTDDFMKKIERFCRR